MTSSPVLPSLAPASEAEILALVEDFYQRGRADPVLGPVFDAAIQNWPEHIALVADFWSHVLLGTKRYGGSPFAPHINRGIEPVHFELWLEHFTAAATATLPAAAADKAIRQAQHMTKSFMVGLFPFVGADGKPAAKPA